MAASSPMPACGGMVVVRVMSKPAVSRLRSWRWMRVATSWDNISARVVQVAALEGSDAVAVFGMSAVMSSRAGAVVVSG